MMSAIFEGDHRMQHLWSIEVESKQATQLTTGTDYTVRAMTWAPDSARLAFGAGPTPMIRDERQDLHIVTLATKAIDSIVATPAPESGPRWSPDGTTIAFTMLPLGDATTNRDGIMTRPLFNSRLMLYDVATRKVRDVSDPRFDNSPGAIVWTPDGKRLLFGVGDRAYRSVVAYTLVHRSIQQAHQRSDDRVRQWCPEQRRFESRIHDGFFGRTDRCLHRRG